MLTSKKYFDPINDVMDYQIVQLEYLWIAYTM